MLLGIWLSVGLVGVGVGDDFLVFIMLDKVVVGFGWEMFVLRCCGGDFCCVFCVVKWIFVFVICLLKLGKYFLGGFVVGYVFFKVLISWLIVIWFGCRCVNVFLGLLWGGFFLGRKFVLIIFICVVIDC